MSIKKILEKEIEDSVASIKKRLNNGWDEVVLKTYISGVSNTFNDIINSLCNNNLISESEQKELNILLSDTLDIL